MTGQALGLVLGTGLFCLWWSCWPRSAAARPPRPAGRLARDLQQAGLGDFGPTALAATCGVCALTALLLVAAATRVASLAVCFALLAGSGPVAAVRARGRRRSGRLREAWPEAIDHLVSAVRAGLSLPEALGQLGRRGPQELRPAFVAFAVEYRTDGRFGDALDQLKSRLADPVGERVVESLRLARDVGGSDLGRLLRTLSGFLRDDARLRSELESRQGWTVNAARLAVAAPWCVLGLLATRPEAVAAYSTPTGALVLVAGGALTGVSYAAMLRVARLPAEIRVLR